MADEPAWYLESRRLTATNHDTEGDTGKDPEDVQEPGHGREWTAALPVTAAALVLAGVAALPAFMRKRGRAWRPRAEYSSVDGEKTSDILEPPEAGSSTACPICGDQAGHNSSCWNCLNVAQVSEEMVPE